MASSNSLLSRRNALRFAGLAFAAGLAGCVTKAPVTVPNMAATDQTAAALPLVNALRAQHGLSPLKIDPAATAAAIYQAKRMAGLKTMSHLIGFGDDFGRRVKASGVKLPAAENIASGQRGVDVVVNAWIHSPHHLENMLGPYTGLGVAVSPGFGPGQIPYWSMVLSHN